jgi:hypothetical protein
MSMIRTIGVLLAALFVSTLTSFDAAAQRGGQHLNSPGYQRALAESRKPKTEPVEPTTGVGKKRPHIPGTRIEPTRPRDR